MDHPDRKIPETCAWLISEWAAKLADVIQSMTDVRPEVELATTGVDGEELGKSGQYWQELPVSIAAEASFVLGAPEETWLKIGDMALRAVGLEQVDPADARNTYLEILNQATSSAVQSLGRRLGHEINVLSGKEAAGLPASAQAVRLEVSAGELRRLPLFVALSAAFESAMTELKPAEPGAPDGREPERALAERPSGSKDEGWTGPPLNSKTLELLMEVELPISVSFGRARLALRDVLKLTSGSIVELNRTVSEPVEVIINGAVIARGEVVVVEGNYGVRIDQIISRQERLRTLK